MNLSDSERVSSVLESLGYVSTEVEEEADILGLVACSVRQRAIDRAFGRIKKWNSWKASRNLVTFATGCVLPADREQFADLFDLFFQINELPKLPDMIRQYGVATPLSSETFARFEPEQSEQSESRARPLARVDHGINRVAAPTLLLERDGSSIGISPNRATSTEFDRNFWQIRPSYQSGFDAYVPIQNGCDKFCSFCAVPFTRGREVSRPSVEVLAEVEKLIENGYKSITLLGQNVNSYGVDSGGNEIGFAELLRRIGEMGRDSRRKFWTYFTSPHPRDMSREVIETIATYPHLAKQIHLPLQSGDDKVLIRMNRNYSVDRYRDVVSNIRELIPAATLFTDIIVGFPGETEEQFDRTRRAMMEFDYNMAYVAMYSPRPGARSARWKDDIPHDEKRRRLHTLSNLLKSSARAYHAALVGSTQTVLVQGRDRDTRFLSGRTEGKIIVRFESDDETLIGGFCDVHITESADMSVQGVVEAVA